jgi:CO/xanthine dehydrogenase FAD-binding subunit
MPAIKHDVDLAVEEGVEFKFLTLPVKATGAPGAIELECVKMALAEPDTPGGRPKPVKIQGSEFTETFDAVIKGIGQKGDMSFIPAEFLNDKGRLKAAEFESSAGKNLYAGGDVVTGPATVVKALAAGRRASTDILIALNEPFHVPQVKDNDWGLFGGTILGKKESIIPARMPIEEAIKNTDKEEIDTINLDLLKEEASRCLNCGCVAVAQADMAPALIALDAIIRTTKRDIPAEAFFTVKKYKSTILDQDEVVKEIEVPLPEDPKRVAYVKHAERKSVDFPIVGAAATCKINADGTVKQARIVMNGVAPIPVVAKSAEEYLIGKKPTEDVIAKAAEIALKGAHSLSQNAYKIPTAKGVVKKALAKTLA